MRSATIRAEQPQSRNARPHPGYDANMTSNRFEFALEMVDGSDWRRFEKLASAFLVDEFPGLRTMASPGGDRGRDAEVFVLAGQSDTMFQYSVAEDWKGKIAATIATILRNHAGVQRLVYATSHQIGARADDLRSSAWNDHKIQLDMRDRSWFVERQDTSPARAEACDEFCTAIVDPILQQKQLVRTIATPLDREESKIALLQLALNSRDIETDRGLTKTCFEALVEAALHDTSAQELMSLEDIKAEVAAMVPSGAAGQVGDLVTSALTRLTVKHGPVKSRDGKYHLSYQASEEWKNQTVDFLLDQQALEEDLFSGAWGLASAPDNDGLRTESIRLRGVLEHVLMARGEAFAEVIGSGDPLQLTTAEIVEEIGRMQPNLRMTADDAAVALMRVLDGPSERTRRHLTRILDAYTLLAFLQQTPDVQKAFSRIFQEADIWLDTSAVLPLIAEKLLDDISDRTFTAMISAARESGMHFYVTDGVIEEVERHLNMCIARAKSPEWFGRTPFLFAAYILSGRSEAEFLDWISEIRGEARPLLDVEEYLKYEFGIDKHSLAADADSADVDLRSTVMEHWLEAHEARRQSGGTWLDDGTLRRMVAVDVENAVGVIQLRKRSGDSPLGYTAWWLTLDKNAYSLRKRLREELSPRAPDSPVLSPDYLSQILRLGPLRKNLSPDARHALPLTTDRSRLDNIPPELIRIANEVRAQCAGYSEHRIRREVRDALDKARAVGVGQKVGMSATRVEEATKASIQRSKGTRHPNHPR